MAAADSGQVGSGLRARWAWPAALAGLVILAAIVRLHDLATRATWDADQGRDMLILSAMLHDGTLPLLGPVTSFGDFHHGAIWYYLLAPAAWLGGGDPTVVVAEIALLASAAVGLVASLARSAAGTVAGLAAGLLMALSASAIDESTFFWNPNLVAFLSALAVWSAWRAWTRRSVRWWLLAAGSQAASMQCHILGAILLPPLVAWFFADALRRAGPDRRRLAWSAAGALGVVALCYLPFIASELQTGFQEVRGGIAYATGGGAAAGSTSSQGLAFRLVFIPLRALAWPLTGLLNQALAAGVLAGVTVIASLAWPWRSADAAGRPLIRWLGATVLWSTVALSVAAPSLEFVTPLPVDHYHAFLDPLIFVAVGIGIGVLWRRGGTTKTTFAGQPVQRVGRLALAGLIALVAAWNIGRWPPSVASDGGYPAAEAAATRIAATVGDRTTLVVSLPSFKTAEAYLYPLQRSGASASGHIQDALGLDSMVVLCDSLFVPDCGGPAEDPQTALMPDARLVDRFIAAPGRTISVYLGKPGG